MEKELSYYQKNKDKILARNKKNKDKLKEYYKGWYLRNRYRILEKRRHEKNPDLKTNKSEKVKVIKEKNINIKKHNKNLDPRGNIKGIEYEMVFY